MPVHAGPGVSPGTVDTVAAIGTASTLAPARRRTLDGDMAELADGVFAYVQPDGGWCLNNAGLVTDGGDALLVDTAATVARTRRLREAVLARTGKPPRYLVNTHHHGDHTYGNIVFGHESVVVGHDLTRVEMIAAGLGMQELFPGVDWGDVTLVPPTLTYCDQLTIHVGELRVELHHTEPAHTTNDTVVWVPQRSVLFTGDIVMNKATPFCLMGSVAGSIRSIAALRRFGAATVVTGHGAVGGVEIFDIAEAYLRWVQRLAAEGVAAGVSPLELARSTDLGEFGGLLDSERLVGNLHRAYAERNGVAPGADLDVASGFTEMMTYHGGPPTCHA
jgi:cyclase